MSEAITGTTICLLITDSILVVTNVALACCIGLVLPKHMKEDNWYYIGDLGEMSDETKRSFCSCGKDNQANQKSPEETGKKKKAPDEDSDHATPANSKGTTAPIFPTRTSKSTRKHWNCINNHHKHGGDYLGDEQGNTTILEDTYIERNAFSGRIHGNK